MSRTIYRERPHHVRPKKKTARVIFCYKDFKGRGFSHVGLGVAANYTAKVLVRNGYWADVWACSAAEDLSARLRAAVADADRGNQVSPSHVVLSAPWVAPEALAKLAAEHPSIKFAVCCHSAVGFLAADVEAIRYMRESAHLQKTMPNVQVSGNATKFVKWATRAWGVRMAYLPNLYDTSEATLPAYRRPWAGQPLRIAMGGAARPLKNGISGAAAVVLLATTSRTPVQLFVSSGRDEGGSNRPIEAITRGVPNLEVIHTGWLRSSEFRDLLRTMSLHLQPSFTESFNMTVADAIAEGVPSVVGEAINWVPDHWVADVDDPNDIARVAESLLHDVHAAEDGRNALERFIHAGLHAWDSFLLARSCDYLAA